MENVDTVYSSILVIVALVSAISSGLGSIAAIKGFWKKAVNKAVEDEVEDKLDQVKDDINSDLETSMLSIESSIEQLSGQIKEIHDDMIDIKRIQKDTTQSNARYVINEAHKLYIKAGWIDSYTMASLEDIFQTYAETGGNHFTADHMENLRELPNEKPVKKASATTKTKAKAKK